MKTSLILLSLSAASANAATIQVENLRNNEGDICISVFDNKDAFPDDAQGAVYVGCTSIGEPIKINLATGSDYAIALFHDENSNGDLDKIGPLGIPEEGFGFSNNPAFKPGVPSFNSVKVKLDSENQVFNIKMSYIL